MIHMFYWYGFVRIYAQIYYKSCHDAALGLPLTVVKGTLPWVHAPAATSTATAIHTPTQTHSQPRHITYYI